MKTTNPPIRVKPSVLSSPIVLIITSFAQNYFLEASHTKAVLK